MRDLGHRRVAMHDQDPVAAPMVQKALADPDEVMLGLAAQIDPGADPGMDDQRLRHQMPQRQQRQPAQMRLGDGAPRVGQHRVPRAAVAFDPI